MSTTPGAPTRRGWSRHTQYPGEEPAEVQCYSSMIGRHASRRGLDVRRSPRAGTQPPLEHLSPSVLDEYEGEAEV